MARENRCGSLQAAHIMMVALTFTLLLAMGIAAAQPVHAASNFIIEDYNIDMQVQEDDTYLITETIDVHFTAPSHGIYRVIPYKIRLDRDGQKSEYYGAVRDFQMLSGQPCDPEKGDEAWYYKIGDPNEYADEDTTYEMSYVFDMKGDHLKDADEVYYNLVGTSWEAQSIEHVSFTVTFPKAIDPNNVGVRTGDQVDGPFKAKGDKVITCDTTENTLRGLTIRAVLPQGYFTKQATTSNLLFYILIAIMAAVTVMGFLLWRRYGRDPDIIETEEFYPPEGLSAPEVGYLDAGEIEGSQITSLLLELADKGYLKIAEKEVPYGLRKKKTRIEYEILREKPYDGNQPDEKAFMDGLFDHGDRTVVDMSDLKDTFYKTVNEIKKDIANRYEDQLWDSRAHHYGWLLRIAGLAGMVALFACSKALNGSPFVVGNGDFMMYIVFHVMEIFLPLIGFYGITKWINRPRKSFGKFLLGFIGWGILILIGFGLAVLFNTCMGAQIFPYLIGMAMVFLLFLMGALCERMTDDYAELLGKIRGFKRFLKVAEKDRMEMLAEQDPNYYYKNLAFAFALGVTSVYAKNFASMAQQPPEWYSSRAYVYGTGGVFDSTSMVHSMDSMMSSVSSSMTSSPSGSGGGGSFSGGGGAGGGGGGSW